MQNTTPHEANEQRTFVDWLELNNYKFTAIPNSTRTPYPAVRRKQIEQGLRAGLPDLFIILKNKRLAFVEMKRQKGGRLTPDQKSWILKINECPGAVAQVCFGADQAIEWVKYVETWPPNKSDRRREDARRAIQAPG